MLRLPRRIPTPQLGRCLEIKKVLCIQIKTDKAYTYWHMNLKTVGLIGVLSLGLCGCSVMKGQPKASPISENQLMSPSPALIQSPLPKLTLLTSKSTASYTFKFDFLKSAVTFSYPSDWTKTGIRTGSGEKAFTFQKQDQKIDVDLDCGHIPSVTGMRDYVIAALTNWGTDDGIDTTLVNQGKVSGNDFGSFQINDHGKTRFANVVNVSDYVGDTTPGKCQLIILTGSDKEKVMADEILSTVTTSVNK